MTCQSGVNFINVLQTAFRCPDPKSTKRLTSLLYFFPLLGSACIKAAHKVLMKLTPGGKLVKSNYRVTDTVSDKKVIFKK